MIQLKKKCEKNLEKKFIVLVVKSIATSEI